MNYNALEHIRKVAKDGCSFTITTKANVFSLDEANGEQWEIFKYLDLLVVYKYNQTIYISIPDIVSIVEG